MCIPAKRLQSWPWMCGSAGAPACFDIPPAVCRSPTIRGKNWIIKSAFLMNIIYDIHIGCILLWDKCNSLSIFSFSRILSSQVKVLAFRRLHPHWRKRLFFPYLVIKTGPKMVNLGSHSSMCRPRGSVVACVRLCGEAIIKCYHFVSS